MAKLRLASRMLIHFKSDYQGAWPPLIYNVILSDKQLNSGERVNGRAKDMRLQIEAKICLCQNCIYFVVVHLTNMETTNTYTHTHTHTQYYGGGNYVILSIAVGFRLRYIYIYICVCVYIHLITFTSTRA